MTGRQFAADHGDPADWTPDEVETWEHLAEADRANDPLATLLGGMTAADGTSYLDIYREAQAVEAGEN